MRKAVEDNPTTEIYTKLAKEKGLSFSEASKLGQATYGEDGYETSNGYWSKSEYRDFNVNDYWNKTILPVVNNTPVEQRLCDQNKQNFDTAELLAHKSPLVVDIGNGASRNLSIKIDAPLAKTTDSDVNTPYYIIIKAGGQWQGADVINIDIKADTVRPLIFCLDPSEQDASAKVHMNIASGKTFRGILYTPNVVDAESDGVIMNAAGANFLGSIVAKRITLNGDNCTYTYEGLGASSEGTSTVTIDPPDINLADVDTNDIDGWTDL